MKILGVKIDNLSQKEILEKIEFFFDEEKFHQIATINPEFILRSQKDDEFKNILNKCDLNVADGVGVWYAFLRHFAYLKTRFAGVDLLAEILHVANERKLSIFLAIHKDGLSNFEDIKQSLNAKYPNIKLGGGNIDPKMSKKWPKVSDYQVVICNFGFPQQEKFIYSVKNDTIRLAVGVGGSFDFLTGKIRRAPVFMRKLGLEWLWRFWQEPRYRLKRIFNAVFVFPAKVLINR